MNAATFRVAPVVPTGVDEVDRKPRIDRDASAGASVRLDSDRDLRFAANVAAMPPTGCARAGWDNRRHPAAERSRKGRRVHLRPGLTLLEVLLALAILAVVMAAVAQLVAVGTRAAQSAEETSLAQIIAESKMNELASGAAPMQASGLTDYEGREGWEYSVDITTIDEPAGLVSVKVFVQQVVEEGDGVSFELYRWMPAEGFIDPTLSDESIAEADAAGGPLTTGEFNPPGDDE